MINVLLVGFGGFLGALSRYSIENMTPKWLLFAAFPYNTLIINGFGCLFIGLLSGIGSKIPNQWLPPHMQLLLVIGFLGSFTTFSTFSLETFNLIYNKYFVYSIINIFLQPGLGLIAVWIGYMISKKYLAN